MNLLLVSLIPFTEGLRLVPGKAFARANVPLHLVMMTTGETAASAAASARLAGPWRRTMYELYDWVSPVGMLTEGNVQDEQVERATLEQQPCLFEPVNNAEEAENKNVVVCSVQTTQICRSENTLCSWSDRLRFSLS